jgi:uncharacterized membrane protein YqhA
MLKRILARSRYLIIIAVIGAFLAAIIVLIYGGLTVGGIMISVFVVFATRTEAHPHIK